MSAFMVDKAHIDLIVAGAIHGPYDNKMPLLNTRAEHNRLRIRMGGNHIEASPEYANEIGQMLVDENVRSLRFRYSDITEDELGGDWVENYEYTDPVYRASIPELSHAIRCYNYQACEHEDYDTSDAKWFVDAFTLFLLEAVKGERGPWGWTATDLAARREKQGPMPISIMDMIKP